MSDDIDDVQYEDDQPQQPRGVIEVLPPPRRQLSWPRVALYAFAILVAGKVVYHAIDSLNGAVAQRANAATQPIHAGMAELPRQGGDRARRSPTEPDRPRPRWFFGVTPRTNGELCPAGDELCGEESPQAEVRTPVKIESRHESRRQCHTKVHSWCPPEKEGCLYEVCDEQPIHQ